MPPPLLRDGSIAVVGAGVIGTSAAFVLAERGYAVTLFDRAEPGRSGPSFGNAGHIAGEGIIPLSTPGIGRKALKMLMDREAPLKIPVGHAPQVAPWLWRFWRASLGDRYRVAIRGMTELNAGAVEATEALFARAGMADKVRREPALYLYESDASFRADLPHWRERAKAGLNSTSVDREEIARLEPGLAPIFPQGVLCMEYGMVTDPIAAVEGYFAAAQARGVTFERVAVNSVWFPPDGIALRTEAGERVFDAILIAAGAWSKSLAATVRDFLPVEAERGYNLTYPAAPATVSRPLLLADRGIAVTPLQPGLRFGGWSELGGTRLPPRPSRWSAMRRIADAVIPGLKDAPAREWMGHRPAMPDSVPVISPSARSPRLFYAVGHGHYGLSFSARTAGIVGEMIGDGREFPAFSINRFR